MSYEKVALGVGVALLALVILSSGITLATRWGMMFPGLATWDMGSPMGAMMGNHTGHNHGDADDHGDVVECPMMGNRWNKNAATGYGKAGKLKLGNLTIIEGTVKAVNRSKGYIVVESDGEEYVVRVFKVYVRIDDGALVLGAWLLGNIGVGDSIKLVGLGSNGQLKAVELSWSERTYQVPAYYMYLLRG